MSFSTSLVFLENFRTFPTSSGPLLDAAQHTHAPPMTQEKTLGCLDLPSTWSPPTGSLDTAFDLLGWWNQSSKGVPPQSPPSCLPGLPSLAKALATPLPEMELLGSFLLRKPKAHQSPELISSYFNSDFFLFSSYLGTSIWAALLCTQNELNGSIGDL